VPILRQAPEPLGRLRTKRPDSAAGFGPRTPYPILDSRRLYGMETARAARGGRRHNLSLRELAPVRARRDQRSLESAFESFYRKHVAEVYQYALAVLTNPADAEDVTQQTFLNAYRAFQKGERPHKPHNWLIKIAHNVCRMRWRQSGRRPQEIPLEQAPEPATLEDEKPSLDDVLAALARLPFNQRAAIVMREVEGRTYSEIADVLNTTVPAVEALLFRARTNLRSRRKALDLLTVAPLPGSLSSFFGGSSGGVLAAGGAALGSQALLKVAAIVVSGAVVGGLGFKTVKAVAKADPAPRLPAQTYRAHRAPAWANPVRRIERSLRVARTRHLASFRHPRRGTSRSGAIGSGPTNDLPGDPSGSSGATAGETSGGAAEQQPSPEQQPQAASSVTTVVASVPVQAPPAPVPVPPAPPLPSVTVTVPTLPVTLPPPPPIIK
jgi:RNA polymerase sigma-70 factor (ECF subfamily)